MNNPFLAEEISFYGAVDAQNSANFYGAVSATNAASAQNPYAVLALFDASFATFGADYAEALAAINAAIADLSGAIAKLDAAKDDENELKKAKEAVTAGALERAKSTADFAANVAERESKIAATTEKIATAMGVSAGKDASAETIAAALTDKVAQTAGIKAADVANLGADVASSGLAAAALKTALGEQLKSVAAQIEAAASTEAAAATDAIAKKAAAVQAKNVAIAEGKIAAAKAKGAAEDSDEIKGLNALKAQAEAKTVEAIKSDLSAKTEALKTAAQAAKDVASANAGKSAAELKDKIAQAASDAAQKAKNEAAKSEAQASEKVVFDGMVFKTAADFGKFAGNLQPDKISEKISALTADKWAANGIIGAEGVSFSAPKDNEITITWANGIKLAINAKAGEAKSTAAIGEVLGHMDADKFTAGDIAAAGIKKIGEFAVRAGSNGDSDKIIVTLKKGVDFMLHYAEKIGDDNTGKYYTAKDGLALQNLSLEMKLKDFAEGKFQPVETEAFTFGREIKDYMPVNVQGVDFMLLPAWKTKSLSELVTLLSAADAAAAKTAAKALGGVEGKDATIANDNTLLSAIDGLKDIADGEAYTIKCSEAVKGYVVKEGGVISWLPVRANDTDAQLKISGINLGAKSSALLAASVAAADITALKNILAAKATSADVSGVKFSLSATAGASSAEIAGAKLTLADNAKIADVVKVSGESKVSDLQSKNVSKIGDIELQTSCGLKIGTVTLTHHADATLADVKGLSAASTGWQLNKAKITAVAGKAIEYDDSDLVKMTITGTDPEKKYDISKATLANIAKLADGKLTTDEALKNANIIEITNIVADLQHADYKTLTTIDQLLATAKASELKKGQDVLVKDASGAIGYINKAGDDGYEYAPDAGNLGISKLKTTATIADLKKVKDNDATLEQIKAIAAEGAQITVADIAIPAKIYGAAVPDAATAAELSAYLSGEDAGKISTLAAVLGVKSNTDSVTLTAGKLEKSGTELKWTAGDGATKLVISKLNDAKLASELAKLASAQASFEALQTVADASAQITVGNGQAVALNAVTSVLDGTTLKAGLSIAQVMALNTSSTTYAQAAPLLAKIDNADVISASELKIGGVSIKGIEATATLANVKTLADTTNATNLKNMIDASSAEKTLTVGDATLKIAKGGSAFTITDSAAKVTFTVDGSATAANISKWASDVKTASVIDASKPGVFDFGDGSAAKTLDLSAYTTANGLKIAAGASASITADASTQAITIKQEGTTTAKSAGTFEITTPELKGDGAHVISFDLTNWGAGDKLMLKFAAVAAGVAGSSEGVIGSDLTVNGTPSQTVKTVVNNGNLGKIQIESNEVQVKLDNDAEAIAIAKKIDADTGAGGTAGASYLLKSQTDGTVYIINAGAKQSENGSDAVIVKLSGLGASDAFAIDTSNGLVTITGAAAAE